MATGDKLVKLDGLKAVYDTLNADVGDLKSAVTSQQTQINGKASTTDLAAETARAEAEEARIEALFTAPTQEAVDNWLDEHPEATTTVQDGSLTEAKFSDALKLKAIKDYVTPQMYGAVGDGVADDTQAFLDAISTERKVFIPIGTYKLTDSLQLNRNQSMVGESIRDTILQFNGSDGIELVTYSDVSGNALSDFSIIGNTGKGVILSTTNCSKLSRLYIKGFDYGIYATNSVNNVFDDLYMILNGTGIYIGANSIYNKLNNSVITSCGTGIGGDSNASLVAYSIDIEASSVCDITGITTIVIYNGHFEGYGTSPLSINIPAFATYTLYDSVFVDYTTAISSVSSTSRLYMMKPTFTVCDEDINLTSISHYFILLPKYRDANGNDRTPNNTLPTLSGHIITDVYDAAGYILSINGKVSADSGNFTALKSGTMNVALIKASGRIELAVGTVQANTSKQITMDASSGLNAYTDQVIVSPNNVALPNGTILSAYVTQSATNKITFVIANVTTSDITVGNYTVNYKVL